MTGNDTVPTETILRTLEKYGVALGARSRIRQEELRNHVLLELPDVVWLTVNMRGCTAHVQVVERQRPPHLYTDGEITNVVAARDGLVTSVQALDGEAQVMAGSTVTAGQVLISGVVDSDRRGYRLLHGMGQVWARTWYELSVSVPLTVREKGQETEAVTHLAVAALWSDAAGDAGDRAHRALCRRGNGAFAGGGPGGGGGAAYGAAPHGAGAAGRKPAAPPL